MGAVLERIGNWDLRFEQGERSARRDAGEWSGLTLADHLRRQAQDRPDDEAVIGERMVLRYGEVLEKASALARGLLDMGIRPGETISFQLPNWPETVLINAACALAGFVINPVIPIYREAELRHILRDCRARVLFIPKRFRGVDYPSMITSLRDDLPDLDHVAILGDDDDGLERLIRRGHTLDTPLDGADPDSAKLIIYTSGTTGTPKGVIYSHNQSIRPVNSSFEAWNLGSRARLLMPSPVTHVTGYSYGIEAPFALGSTTIFMEHWDSERACDLIDSHGVDFMIGATPFLSELIAAAAQKGTGLESLRIFGCGGASVPPSVIERAMSTFTNCRAFRVFGSSEAPMITQGCLEDSVLAATTDGYINGWEVVVRGEDDAVVRPGQEGEICAKGPSLFRGYTDPTENPDSFDADGYFRTGDLGWVDSNGVLTITGRKKDLIIRGGENLSAKEIEDTLHNHPAIEEAAVVAMRHVRLGEGVAVCLIPAGRDRPDRKVLAAWLEKQGLARQKWPEYVEYRDTLPKTASGKVQKHLLRRDLAERFPEGYGVVPSN
ncbi:Acyl-CoA synthetase (AMP-forming)/AMP-acid ligase II [Salinihabitans flavidus]|uniref:Acyl-CoA synthetase (AMP-forming)/AMP-acid ligase II n=1 Tax=Salinihabitans flavidus TaxID=569882 RepID=A0A1H8RM90_9RHOB|nr:AMP-binding protein [Salinihabitans flavidus]SEO67083.1 Acyl-CoA synthetase (AMP-forming)/AMP-acid ligase II [Salinihabitans flavidus]